jgi:hypothetical protein
MSENAVETQPTPGSNRDPEREKPTTTTQSTLSQQDEIQKLREERAKQRVERYKARQEGRRGRR